MSNQKKNTPFDGEQDISALCVSYRLKELRTEHGLTQSDLASVLNISSREYWRFEQPNYCTRYANLLCLSLFYNVSLDYIFGLTNEKKKVYNETAYDGKFGLCESSFTMLMPNVKEYKKQKAEAKK